MDRIMFPLPKKMKGYALLGPGKTGWVERPVPECGPYDAICRPIALAPCTSDVHSVWECGPPGNWPKTCLGHEAIGEIVQVGESVTQLRPGDHVVVPAITPDWRSPEAQEGFSMHSHGLLGGYVFTSKKDGVFAEYFHVNDVEDNAAKLPPGLDPTTALMLTDMATTGLHGAELAQIQLGDTVAVIGIGPVGLMSVAGARLRGASRIYAVGSRPRTMEVAREFGATHCINYKDGPIDEHILRINQGPVDRVIIAGGDSDLFDTAVRIVKAGGVIGNVSYLSHGNIEIDRVSFGLGMGHKFIHGGLTPGGGLRMEKLIRLVQTGRIHPGKLITHRFEGLESVEKALLLMKDKPADLIKPVVTISYPEYKENVSS
eukprot:Protomagalhaensia_wolfi_Nauph_80__5574@NODE_61_length_4114_cov_422_848344_g50_i1_p3_GENE_NODE_61_length_4114_cov_422_848344_g50_i1NODE_61_length_4114_cov_422_848344_g50_i1_p3_ORF_typecomplete_len373_score47_33ADH_zinc_N/PF00107_26/8_2e20Glu_dehyd_C/PF16912_5/2_9e16ADH_N/PF08240_12/4_3e15ADH_N/PF08240_12/4e03AlaDh_PNT_C/PF01262_21/1_4e05ADH_zinc_N_2/PF13602_6/8_9e03ADH_zinc_N_2/PF13602_6/6_7e05PCMT/PF01135_19/7_8e02PCMT/PF01135_19/0_12Pyr_redox_2/PF07992_14/4_9e02Pyr_redox_2/PF07992_14/0_96Pyr_re